MAASKNMRYYMIVAAVIAVLALLYVVAPKKEGFVANPSGADTFTLFYADWCPHCKAVKPVYAEWSASKTMQVKGKTVFLDMVEVDTNPEKVQGKPVKGYPTFLLEKADGTFVEFDGERTPAGWKSWLEANL
jgi:thiol-disulfide isomerase/thioredoxin